MKTSVDGLEFKHPNTSRVYLIGFKPYNLKAQYSAVFFSGWQFASCADIVVKALHRLARVLCY